LPLFCQKTFTTSESTEAIIQRAISEAKAGNKEATRIALSQVVRQEPQNARAWYLLSQVVERPERVIYCLEQVLSIQPNNEQIRQRLGIMRGAVPLVVPAQSAPVIPTKPVKFWRWDNQNARLTGAGLYLGSQFCGICNYKDSTIMMVDILVVCVTAAALAFGQRIIFGIGALAGLGIWLFSLASGNFQLWGFG
jgi:hypothetical protein